MISLEYLAFEVTRRCNECCKMCMRGDPEEIDMSQEVVNKVLLNNNIRDIETILFSGGEPTLNENLVCYIIDLIIKNNILVSKFSLVTNAKKFPKLILEAFDDYQKYCSYENIKSNIVVNFSVDVFHENHQEIISEYREKYPNFHYDFKGLSRILKTGRAEYGEKFEYKIDPMLVDVYIGFLSVMNSLYITAKGNYETIGDGMYSDMDQVNMGSVFDNSLLDILEQYGKVVYGSKEQFKRMIYRAKNI